MHDRRTRHAAAPGRVPDDGSHPEGVGRPRPHPCTAGEWTARPPVAVVVAATARPAPALSIIGIDALCGRGMTPLTPVGPARPGERHHRGRGPTVVVVSRPPHRRHLASLGLADARPIETTTVAMAGQFVLPRLGPGQGGVLVDR